MAQIAEDGYGGVTILLSSGLEVRLPGVGTAARNPTMQDIANVVSALLVLVKDLDDRLVKLEKK